MGPQRRVNVGLLQSHHKELIKLTEVTGQKLQALTDKAMANFLKDVGPVLRRMAKEMTK